MTAQNYVFLVPLCLSLQLKGGVWSWIRQTDKLRQSDPIFLKLVMLQGDMTFAM